MSDQPILSVRVNGEHQRVSAGLSVYDMLVALGLNPARVAVERNLAVVARGTLTSVRVEDGDEFEVVHFVGGG